MMGIDTSKRCEGYYCGQYQISYTYWAEAGKPGNNQSSRDYEKCVRDRSCAEQAVKAYFRKFKRDCNNDGLVDCLDMAALHKAGPTSCSADWFYKSRYWQSFNKTTCVTDKDAINAKETLEDQSGAGVKAQSTRPMKNQTLTSECLDCICDAVSGCSLSVNNCGSGTVCGPFAISQAYWKDGRRPGVSWTSCARTKECSSVTVKNYMEKYKKDCNGDGLITCEDYAAIHRRGPRACMNKDLQKDHYWNKFLSCRANQKPTHDVNLVKVGGDSGEESANRIESVAPITTTTTTSSTSLVTKEQDYSTNKPQNLVKLPSGLSSNRFDYSQDSTYELTSIGSSAKVDEAAPPRAIMPVLSHTLPDYRPSVQLVPPKLPFLVRQPSPVLHNSSGTSLSALAPPKPTINELLPKPMDMGPILQTTPGPPSSSLNFHTESSQSNTHTTEVDFSASKESPASSTVEYPSIPLVDDIDYSPDFPSAAGQNPIGSGMDKTTSFDKVVTGIVGSPDFSKSYPPVPEIVSLQSKPVQTGLLDSAPDASASNLVVKSQQKVTTNHSRSHGRPPSAHPTTSQPASAAVSGSSSNQAHSKTSDFQQRISPTGSAVNQLAVPPAHDPINKSPDQGPRTAISGPDAVNMSSLFDKGLNESSRISSECLECICDASSNCDTTVQCISKQREKNRCGLYMISWNQFQDSDIALTSLAPLSSGAISEETYDEKLYYDCTTDRVCAEKLIHLYIEKYQKDCNDDGKIDCYDIAAIHRVGPDQCNTGKFLSSQYWKDFNNCYTNDRLVTPTTVFP